MQTIGKAIPQPRYSVKTVVGSAVAHLLLLASIGLALHRGARFVAPYKLPGSEHGTNFLVSYMPGRAPAPSAVAQPAAEPKLTQAKSLLPAPPRKKTEAASPNSHSPASAVPDSASGADALGSGNISIALTTYFPPPKPDLSALPRGTKGDVILDVVIDTNGRISDVKMMSGLGYGIDETVIATIEQWTFHPATQNGRPVASEQELHFHYERS